MNKRHCRCWEESSLQYFPQTLCLISVIVIELQTWHLYEENRLLDLVDTDMLSSYSEEEALRVIHVALLCTQASPSQRPSAAGGKNA
jgi:hypothetical protein